MNSFTADHELPPGEHRRAPADILCPCARHSSISLVNASGGTLGETMEFAGWGDAYIADFIHHRLGPHVAALLRDSQKAGLTLTEIAKPRTLERFGQVAQRASRADLRGRIPTQRPNHEHIAPA